MKTLSGLNTHSRKKPTAHSHPGEYSQKTASGRGGGKCIEPTGAQKAKASMHHGPFGGKAPQS